MMRLKATEVLDRLAGPIFAVIIRHTDAITNCATVQRAGPQCVVRCL